MIVHVIVIVIPCKIRSLENLCIESDNFNMGCHSRVKALSHSLVQIPARVEIISTLELGMVDVLMVMS